MLNYGPLIKLNWNKIIDTSNGPKCNKVKVYIRADHIYIILELDLNGNDYKWAERYKRIDELKDGFWTLSCDNVTELNQVNV